MAWTPYVPRSPYSASKAASDHLVNAWHHTYGPWQLPEKPIPLDGDGLKVRDWLYVDDHVDALLPAGAPTRISRELGWQPHRERTGPHDHVDPGAAFAATSRAS
jgi:dTDP-glucose 4,6-dehydratase